MVRFERALKGKNLKAAFDENFCIRILEGFSDYVAVHSTGCKSLQILKFNTF